MGGLKAWYERTAEEVERERAAAAEAARQAWLAGEDLLGDAAKGFRDFGEAQLAAHQLRTAQQARAARSGGTPPAQGSAKSLGLRGPQPAVAAPARGSNRYLADLTNPDNLPFMTTCAGKDCRHSYIDEYPASGLGTVPMSDAELRAGITRLLTGAPIDAGPRVTFVNDNPNNPTPRQPLTTPTARMVAAGIVDSGFNSFNINSTTGGHKDSPNSRHNFAKAVDINRINGRPVRPGNRDTLAFQDALSRQSNIRENFGPDAQTKVFSPGGRAVPQPKARKGHQDHSHFSGQR